MATNSEHGIAGILAESGVGAAAENLETDQEPEIVADMFGDAPLLPVLVTAKDKNGKSTVIKRAGPGRPPGSGNLATDQLRKLVMAKYGHPVLRLAEIASTPIHVLALTLECTMLEAAEFSRKVQNDVASYVAHKLPQSVQVELKTAGMLAIYTGNPADEHGKVSAHGLEMKVIEPDDKTIENQQVSNSENEKCHGESVTEVSK